ncbi:MAG: J domain-containing protein [Dehalococcoidia bacterium]
MAGALPGDDDLYAVLGVGETASVEQIRGAYRSLAQRFHPDHNQNDMAAVRRMQEINRAFTVLVTADTREAYDRRRRLVVPRDGPDGCHGAGRGPRPYFRGQNWGLHTGADAPPEHIVRVDPAGFNLVVSADGHSEPREVRVRSDAPFSVTVRTICSPWLSASDEFFVLDAGGAARLSIGVAEQARRELRGWRDGGVSLVTDDTRVFCPDIRITAIFLGQAPAPAPLVRPAERVEMAADCRPAGGWLRRVLRR